MILVMRLPPDIAAYSKEMMTLTVLTGLAIFPNFFFFASALQRSYLQNLHEAYPRPVETKP